MGFERAATIKPAPLIDPFQRAITYLRVSVTDRCDFRCVYCMSENMSFLPKQDLLTLEELDRLCSAFVARGVRKLRLTGGEPLVRRGIMTLVRSLSRHLGDGLDELTLTTNGSQLPKYAAELADCGVKRINVSLDTLDADKFRAITRWGELDKVMAGIDAAQAAGLAVKINAVALKGVNEDELGDLVAWSHGRGMDLTIIEVMPLGDIEENRLDQYLPLSMVRARLAERYTMEDIDYRTGGPARYVRVAETGGRLGFITPLTHNFCESCNRVRLTCTGTLYMCLGQEDAADLRAPLRASESNDLVNAAIDAAILRKPKGHDFVIDRRARAPGGVAPHERDRRLDPVARACAHDRRAHIGYSRLHASTDAPRTRVTALAHSAAANCSSRACGFPSEFPVTSARANRRGMFALDGRDGGVRHQRHAAEADRAALSARRSHHGARHDRDLAGRIVPDRPRAHLRIALREPARADPHHVRRPGDGHVHHRAHSHAARRAVGDQSRLAADHHGGRGDLLRAKRSAGGAGPRSPSASSARC